jgi:hypothetical protein
VKAVSAAELTAIRAETASAACDLACVVKRNTGGSADGYGTSTEGLTTIETTTAGMANPQASLLQNYAYKIGSLATFLVQLPYGSSALEDDILAIAGKTLKVQIVLDPSSYQALHTVLASEVI